MSSNHCDIQLSLPYGEASGSGTSSLAASESGESISGRREMSVGLFASFILLGRRMRERLPFHQ